MSTNNDIKRAERFVRKAERMVRESGFDPDDIVSETDVENLTPDNRLHFLNFVLRKLQLADALLASEDPIPNPEYPDEGIGFKTNGAVLVVYDNDGAMWHMERHGEEWKNYRFYISFGSIEDIEYKTPERRIAEATEFMRKLKRVDNEVKGVGYYFPNPFNLDSDYRFKKNENFVVAYRGDNPVWYLKRENDEWETHKMTVSREPTDDAIEALLQEIADDFEDFDEFDEFEGLDEDWPKLP